MQTASEITFKLGITNAEYRLIGLALAGKLTDNKDIQAAKELNLRFCEQRITHLKDHEQAALRALQCAKEAMNEPEKK